MNKEKDHRARSSLAMTIDSPLFEIALPCQFIVIYFYFNNTSLTVFDVPPAVKTP